MLMSTRQGSTYDSRVARNLWLDTCISALEYECESRKTGARAQKGKGLFGEMGRDAL